MEEQDSVSRVYYGVLCIWVLGTKWELVCVRVESAWRGMCGRVV